MSKQELAANRITAGKNSVGFFRGLNHLQWNRANEEDEMNSSRAAIDNLTYEGKILRSSIQA
jgi:hypothetical protein